MYKVDVTFIKEEQEQTDAYGDFEYYLDYSHTDSYVFQEKDEAERFIERVSEINKKIEEPVWGDYEDIADADQFANRFDCKLEEFWGYSDADEAIEHLTEKFNVRVDKNDIKMTKNQAKAMFEPDTQTPSGFVQQFSQKM